MLCVIESDFFKKIFCPKNAETWPKIGFLDLSEHLDINFFWIWSIKTGHHGKKSLIFCILIQINGNLKNIGVGEVKNGCGHTGLRTLKLAVSQKGINGINWFKSVDKHSGNPKVALIIFGWSWSKICVAF